jgi:hypothetical protein
LLDVLIHTHAHRHVTRALQGFDEEVETLIQAGKIPSHDEFGNVITYKYAHFHTDTPEDVVDGFIGMQYNIFKGLSSGVSMMVASPGRGAYKGYRESGSGAAFLGFWTGMAKGVVGGQCCFIWPQQCVKQKVSFMDTCLVHGLHINAISPFLVSLPLNLSLTYSLFHFASHSITVPLSITYCMSKCAGVGLIGAGVVHGVSQVSRGVVEGRNVSKIGEVVDDVFNEVHEA